MIERSLKYKKTSYSVRQLLIKRRIQGQSFLFGRLPLDSTPPIPWGSGPEYFGNVFARLHIVNHEVMVSIWSVLDVIAVVN